MSEKSHAFHYLFNMVYMHVRVRLHTRAHTPTSGAVNPNVCQLHVNMFNRWRVVLCKYVHKVYEHAHVLIFIYLISR